jgi:ABC-type Zn uptake system ZnuABC Zn-binding protein ZnuA
MKKIIIIVGLALVLAVSACQPAAPAAQGGLKVLAVETFLADIVQNVAGGRAQVEALIPMGLDPHAFTPAPRDVARIAESKVLVVNGAGFEEWLKPVLTNTGGQRLVIEAAAGLTGRAAREGEVVEGAQGDHHDEGDPHFWLDPLSVLKYVENIRDGLTQVDPEGKEIYASNAAAYIARLKELDTWIQQQVKPIPVEQRLLVTNHESLGYFADRYGFKVVGTVVPSVSTEASPSAQQLARLIDQVRASGVRAIFLETGSNPQLAEQIAAETKAKVVTGLHTHSVTPPNGPAPTYIDMIKANVNAIVGALGTSQ